MSLALISWQSVIAGAITTLAISIIMGVLGVALGFTVVKPRSDHPLSGLGTAFGVWSVISVIASLAAGGFVAGMFSGMRGTEHGFMVWASVLLLATLFSGLAVGTAVRTFGSAVKTMGSGAASVVSSVGGGVQDLASGAVDRIKDSVDLNFDADHLGDEVSSVPQDTGVDTLQPEYLKQQMQEARGDLRASLHELRMDTENYGQIIDRFVDKQKGRLEKITGDVDKNAAVTALMYHRNLPREEAEKTVDNALKIYNKAVARAKDSLVEARDQFNDAKEYMAQMAEQARIKADKFSSSAARSALAAGIALILGAVISCYAGMYGNRYADRDAILFETRRSVTIPLERPFDRPLRTSMERP